MISGDKLFKLAGYFNVPIGAFYHQDDDNSVVCEREVDYNSVLVVLEKISSQLKRQNSRLDRLLDRLGASDVI